MSERRQAMNKTFTIVSTAVVTAILTSAFWIFTYNIVTAPSGKVKPAGDVAVVNPPAAPPVAIAEGVVVGPAGLAIPVAGVKVDDLVDTYTAARAGGARRHDAIDIMAPAAARAGGARRHDAIDIMAPAGTPVVAAAPGTVEKLFFSDGGGGITAYIRSPDRNWSYYYAHLQEYAPGLKEGQAIKRGQLIGRVGSTGNASAAGPHLHFAINEMSDDESWHEGSPINPYPLLAGEQASR